MVIVVVMGAAVLVAVVVGVVRACVHHSVLECTTASQLEGVRAAAVALAAYIDLTKFDVSIHIRITPPLNLAAVILADIGTLNDVDAASMRATRSTIDACQLQNRR
jgi:hypothetical protein